MMLRIAIGQSWRLNAVTHWHLMSTVIYLRPSSRKRPVDLIRLNRPWDQARVAKAAGESVENDLSLSGRPAPRPSFQFHSGANTNAQVLR